MLIKSYELKVSIINIYTKIYYIYIHIFVSISLKFNYVSNKVNKMIVLIYLPKT